jgi:hypothetical protein
VPHLPQQVVGTVGHRALGTPSISEMRWRWRICSISAPRGRLRRLRGSGAVPERDGGS